MSDSWSGLSRVRWWNKHVSTSILLLHRTLPQSCIRTHGQRRAYISHPHDPLSQLLLGTMTIMPLERREKEQHGACVIQAQQED